MRQIRYSILVGALVWLVGCGMPTTGTETNAALGALSTAAQPAVVASAPAAPSQAALPPVQPDAEQQAALDDPEQVVQLLIESLKQQRFAAVEPLMSDEVRARLAGESGGGSVAAYYQEREATAGRLLEYRIFNRHTVYDSDNLVAFDLDLQHERQLNQGKILLTRTASGWQIAGVDNRTQPSLAEVPPSEEQRAAMQADPAQVARVFGEGLKQQQFEQIEALFSYFARQTFGSPGSLAAHYRDSARRFGPLLDYSVGAARMQPEDFAEVDVSLIHEQGPLPTRIVLKKTPQGWKISRVVVQQ